MLIDAMSFLVSSLSIALVRISFNVKKGEQQKKTSIRSDVVEGLRYVLSHPVLRNISIMMALVNFVANASNNQIVLFAKERLAASDAQVSLLFSAASLGIVIMGLLAGPLRKHWSFSTVALGALMSEGLLGVIFAQMRLYWVAAFIWMIAGGVGILFNINTGSLRQAIVPNHMLGRVISIASVLAWSAIPLGSLLGGFVITWTHNVALIFTITGILTFLIPFGFSFTALGHADRYIPKKEEKKIEEADLVPGEL
jgi:MFS family permease